MRSEVQQFLIEKKLSLGTYFDDPNWVTKLTYLSEIFSILNKLNLSMQEPQSNIFVMINKIRLYEKITNMARKNS